MGSNKIVKWNLQNTYLQLPQEFWSKTLPTPVKSPELVIFNQSLASQLGLGEFETSTNLNELAGNQTPPLTTTISQAYCGHQFGHFNRLGDGRAILLGELTTPDMHRFDIQLKGSGPTPYSRRGDGRAALGPMLREYIISEAMHALGISTTRSLAVVKTGELIDRERELQGAILTRVAASHIRVGTFEYAAALQNKKSLQELADYTIDRHYPDLKNQDDPYIQLLQAVCKKQAMLIAQWLHVGFIHGVMNTDNMSIAGETIDYGPCAFMDTYHPKTVFSSIDRNGRYAYNQQAAIGQWNLTRFAETLLPLVDDNIEIAKEKSQNALNKYNIEFEKSWKAGLLAKFGFNQKNEIELSFLEKFMQLLLKHKADYTTTFRNFHLTSSPNEPIFQDEEFKVWLNQWRKLIQQQGESFNQTIERMNQSNPYIIPRNHQVEAALEAAEQNDLNQLHRLLTAIKNPFEENGEFADLAAPPANTNSEYKTFCGT